MITQLLKLIEDVNQKQQIMKDKDANVTKTKEELEAKVEELQVKLTAINDQITKNKGKDTDRYKEVMKKAVESIGNLLKT